MTVYIIKWTKNIFIFEFEINNIHKTVYYPKRWREGNAKKGAEQTLFNISFKRPDRDYITFYNSLRRI